ncbi:hypothetical protein Nm8I071_23410 [Nonomuraea sp. TT08I-71]|nr:hypothetical protein Nm8I071_23410 [Nonomuraea sp. TT08I-71]
MNRVTDVRAALGLRRTDEEPLPPTFRRFTLAQMLTQFGTGLTMPFIPIYITTHLQLGIGSLGSYYAATAATTLIAALFGGRLADSVGPKVTLLSAAVALAAANLWLALLNGFGGLLVNGALVGLGSGLYFSALMPMILRLVAEAQRRRAFALRYLTMNVGLGSGTVVGAVVVASWDGPMAFRAMFLLKALTFVQFGRVVYGLTELPPAPRKEQEKQGGYRALLTSGPVLLVLAVQALLVTFCFIQLDTSIPVVVHDFMGLDLWLVGLLAVVNTVAVVLLQMPALTLFRRISDAGTLAYAASAWVVAFAIGALATFVDGLGSAALLLVFSVVFAFAETAYATAFHPLLAKVVPSDLIGRVNGLSSVVWNTGTVVGPLLVLGGAAKFGAVTAWLILAAAGVLAVQLTLLLRSSVRRLDSGTPLPLGNAKSL